MAFSKTLRMLGPATLILGLAVSAKAALVSVPYSQNFDGYAVDGPTDFTESSTSAFTIIDYSGSKAYLARLVSTNGSHSGSVQVAGSGGQNFSVASDITRYSETNLGTATAMTISLAAAGTATTFGSTEYRVSLNYHNGTVTFLRNGATTTTTNSGTLPSLATDNTVRLTLSGIYSTATQAQITYTLTDGTNTFTGVYNDSAELNGEYFGFRVAKNSGSGSTVAAVLDNFTLTAVPEPSALALFATAALFAIGRRSRR